VVARRRLIAEGVAGINGFHGLAPRRPLPDLSFTDAARRPAPAIAGPLSLPARNP